MILYVPIAFTVLVVGCSSRSNRLSNNEEQQQCIVEQELDEASLSGRTIHVMVALCDNKYQQIVPVPKGIGDGQNPASNLYWGCGYGIHTYFKRSKEWTHLKTSKHTNSTILERSIFKHKQTDYYLVADAYDGRYIKQCTKDFLYGLAGQFKDTLQLDGKVVGLYGYAHLLSYIGHDGLMEFDLPLEYGNADGKQRDCIILACQSRKFFTPYVQQAQGNPVVWTTTNMAPEAYTLHDALEGYVNNESPEQVRTRAAKAYAKYQKCSEKAARSLLATGY